MSQARQVTQTSKYTAAGTALNCPGENKIFYFFQLGAKKGSLGAQKLTNTSFTEIEKQAQAVDKRKEQEDLARGAPREGSM